MSEIPTLTTGPEPEDSLNKLITHEQIGDPEIGREIVKTFDIITRLEKAGKLYHSNKFVVEPKELFSDRVPVGEEIGLNTPSVSLHAGSLDPGYTKDMTHEQWDQIAHITKGLASGSINDLRGEPIFTFAIHGKEVGAQYYPDTPSTEEFTGQIIYNPTGEEVLPGSKLLILFDKLVTDIDQHLNLPSKHEQWRQSQQAKTESSEKAATTRGFRKLLGSIRERMNSGQADTALVESSKARNNKLAEIERDKPTK